MFKTADGGANWDEIDEGVCARSLYSVIVHSDNTQILFVGGQFSVYKTTDGGRGWDKIVKGFKILNFKDISNKAEHSK